MLICSHLRKCRPLSWSELAGVPVLIVNIIADDSEECRSNFEDLRTVSPQYFEIADCDNECRSYD